MTLYSLLTVALFPHPIFCVPGQVQVMRDSYQEYIDTSHDFYDIYPEERMRDVSRYALGIRRNSVPFPGVFILRSRVLRP
jgi:hypothetical protein